jgi:predicted transcriptional regulator
MKAYLDTIQDRAKERDVHLALAFRHAGIPSSTYYRTINGTTELRYETALRVIDAIDELHSIQQAREHTKRLRENGEDVNRRSIRAGIKPRTAGA